MALENYHRYQELLQRLLTIVDPMKLILNVKLSEFITGNLSETAVPNFMLEDFRRPSHDLNALVERILSKCPIEPAGPTESYLTQILELSDVLRKCYDDKITSGAHSFILSSNSPLDRKLCTLMVMNPKKFAEVDRMQTLIADCAKRKNISHVIDIGSGKGYLSSVLALNHGFNVTALELSGSNVISADLRHTKLSRQWSSVRSKFRAENQSLSECVSAGHVKFIERKVDSSLQVDNLLDDTNSADKENVFLCGLHTCGDLGADVVEVFLNNLRATGLIFVSCCYNLMTELYEPDNPCNKCALSSFPMSHALRQQKSWLGRNARMMACQNPERLTSENHLRSTRAIFYRALLQVLLDQKAGRKVSIAESGKIAKADTSLDFFTYVQEAKRGLTIPLNVTKEECDYLAQTFGSSELKLRIFQLIRIRLGVIVEQIIVLDRACHLLEKGCPTTIIPIFDPVISPRFWAICSLKPSA